LDRSFASKYLYQQAHFLQGCIFVQLSAFARDLGVFTLRAKKNLEKKAATPQACVCPSYVPYSVLVFKDLCQVLEDF